MSLPDKASKHISRKQSPVGTVKDGKIKIKDGATGKISYRQGTTGMSRDYDGDPISANFNAQDMKSSPKHHTHDGRKPHKGIE